MSSVERTTKVIGSRRGVREALWQARRGRGAIAWLLLAILAGPTPATGVEVTPRPSTGCHTQPKKRTEERGIERTLTVDGQPRAYILDVPKAAIEHRPAPLLIDFHGFQHSAAGVWRVSEFRRLGEERGFITAYPQGLPVELLGREGAGWEIFATEGNRDLRFVEELIRQLGEELCLDLSRVYATGFSNGGFLTHLLACQMADRIAGIAPVGAGIVDVPCKPVRPVRVIVHHGVRDERVNVERARALGDRWRSLNGCGSNGERRTDGCTVYKGCVAGGEVAFCEHDLGHHWPAGAGERIWSFFEAR